jgi:hypothetical protein
MAKLDRVFVSTSLGVKIALAKVTCLTKDISDHTPILVDSGESCHMRMKRFIVEKWWLKKAEFRGIVGKAWDVPCVGMSSLDTWSEILGK